MVTSVTDQQDGFSDYGSDFTPDEEEILRGLLQQVPDPEDNPNADIDLLLRNNQDDEPPRGAKIPRRLGYEQKGSTSHAPECSITVQFDHDTPPPNVESAESRGERERSGSIEAPLEPKPGEPDLRSPLERFRTKPKKALSVTDLVSPSWCELQYWYTLTKHGRKRRTPAMKQGTAVHKILEDQVHQTVAVDLQTNEDAWGLRIWNVIQGLKTLRETGMTRELEVWGVFDGQVVNGVIDELSHICPDRDLEEAEEKPKSIKPMPAADQATITDFLGPSTLESDGLGFLKTLRPSTLKHTSKTYITDIKTRATKSIPKSSSFRPTMMQLMLYHRLLSDLATNRVNADILFDRYELKADHLFSDSFIAQIGSLNEAYYDEPDDSSQSDSVPDSTQDSVTLLLSHNSLRSLWELMIQGFFRTMPAGVRDIGNVLKAEFRTRNDGQVLGVKTFLYDDKVLQAYLKDELSWWKGERAAEGVCVEEAYKCGSCDFAQECSWRINKIEEATLKLRERKRSAV